MLRIILSTALLTGCLGPPERMRITSHTGSATGTKNSERVEDDSSKDVASIALVKQGALHRLNRREYNATVRDLLGTRLRPAESFPEDPVGSNFDNEGDALSISPSLTKYYYTAATKLADEVASKDFLAVTQCKQVTDTACLDTYIAAFGLRAWRRPLTAAERKSILEISTKATAGSSSPNAEFLRQTITQFLVSPYFIFRIELDDAPSSKAVRKLNAYELASRLSYFLWSSMPDDRLLSAAADGSLLKDEVIAAKVKEMLQDPRSSALIDGFAEIWLAINKSRNVVLDAKLFPKFSTRIRDAMVQETRLFFQEYLTKELDINTMLTSDFTFLNDELASYYGLPAPNSKTHVRAALQANTRNGLLMQGSILSATSTEARTSIVKRGTFILGNILCRTPPDLPPGVTIDPLPEIPDPSKTTRQILADHISKPACAGCHAIIDPPGFALEAFGPDGLARTTERGHPVDSSGAFDGNEFKGAMDFSELVQSSTAFSECATRKMLSYAMGRGLTESDDLFVSSFIKKTKQTGRSFASLIEAVALSEAFRSR
jgi:hypothetical protein